MARIVVIGNGMVGSRFAADVVARDTAAGHQVLVLGDEQHEPYNRVLLSDFVAGRTPAAALALPVATALGRPPAACLRGLSAVRIDRGNKVVHDGVGATHGYDYLVLATGSRARIPDLAGLEGDRLPPGVLALRTLDDAHGIVAASRTARTAVVLGGGVLGLEAATGLARRGLAVTVVHMADTLMERQLDGTAGAVAVDGLRALGVHTQLCADARAVLTGPDGRVSGLCLSDGRVLPTDLLVLSCGTVARTELARDAGLSVDRGIVVGADLASPDDPCVFAIGDCASPPEGGRGLIAQGWDQARRLAARLTSGATAPAVDGDATSDVVRLKAEGLDIVAMGAAGPRRCDGHRVLRLSDPGAGRHVEVVVDGGRVVGAICIGSPAVAADLTVAYTRGTPLPEDPAALLLPPAAAVPASAGSPTNMPDRLTVCRCNGVTKGDITSCWSQGARTRADVAARTRATTGCGGCTDVVDGLLEWLANSDPEQGAQPATPPRRARGAATSDARPGQPELAVAPA